MNKPGTIVIVRTVSVEKLSPVLDACRARWPDGSLCVVTGPGRASELQGDPRVASIVEYAMGPGGFDHPLSLAGQYAALVIPVGNRYGSGYANVMQACRDLRVGQRFLAPYCRELRELSSLRWSLKWRMEWWLSIPARWIGRIWAARMSTAES